MAVLDTETYLSYDKLQKYDAKIKGYIKTHGGGNSAYSIRGSVAGTAALPALSSVQLGWIYNDSVGGETTADFIEGTGHSYSAGMDIACIDSSTTYTEVTPEGTENPAALGWYISDGDNGYVLAQSAEVVAGVTYYTHTVVKKWNLLGSYIDLTPIENAIKQKLSVVTAMPTADLYDGYPVLYLGANTEDYVNGRVYKYDLTNETWVLQGNGMNAITSAQIDALFD